MPPAIAAIAGMSTSSAIIGASIIGGVAAVGAANVSAGATRDAIGVQDRQFQQTFEALAPYRALGEQGIAGLENLLLGSPEEVQNNLESRPGYKFRFGQGQKSVEAGQAAKSGLLSGRAGKELQAFGQEFASAEFDKEFDRFTGMVNVGRGVESTTATAGANTAGNISNLTVAGGKAQAQGITGLNNAVQGGIQNYRYFNQLNSGGGNQPWQFNSTGVPTTQGGLTLDMDFAS